MTENLAKELERNLVLGADGKTMVYVYDGLDVEYVGSGKFKNYAYYFDKNGKRFKTRPYSQYTSMTNRCKLDGRHQKIYKDYVGVTLSDEFKNFDDWVEWATTKFGFMCEDSNGNLYQQDKDLLSNKRVYSKETCCFIPPKLNGLLKMFSGETKGIRVTAQGAFHVVVVGKTIHARTKEEAICMALQRDIRTFKTYIFDNFSVLDELVIDTLLDRLKELEKRDITNIAEKIRSVQARECNHDFITELNNVTSEKPNSIFPHNVQIQRKRSGTQYTVLMNFRGKSVFGKTRVYFDTLHEAEVFQAEEKIKILDTLFEEYSKGGMLTEKSISKYLDLKNFHKHKILILSCGMF